jgi:uncharacterized membrane protein YphA (DoxX/SURF4 family)
MADKVRAGLFDRLNTAIEQARADLVAISNTWNNISNLRLVLALPVLSIAFWWLRSGEALTGLLAVGILVLFVAVVVWHARIGRKRREIQARVTFRTQQLARADRDWGGLPPAREGNLPPDHPYANDLDLIGPGSLLHLIDVTQTPSGFQTLLARLSTGLSITSSAVQQEAARSLIAHGQWREDLAVAGAVSASEMNESAAAAVIARFGTRTLTWRHIAAVVATFATLIVVAFVLAGALAPLVAIALLVVNAGLTFSTTDRQDIGESIRGLRQLRQVLPIAEAVPGDATGIAALRDQLQIDGRSASLVLSAFDRRLSLIVPQGSIIWFPLQIALNWDLLVDALLIRTARLVGSSLATWVDVVGELETLAALGNLADLNPGWTWPEIQPSALEMIATGVAHPLIPGDRRVANDVSVGPAGSVLIVTGSNMAGKSTLLRSVGLNAVLARAGGPVCARSLTMGDFAIWSSVRVQDSLSQGVSLFMAELLRLRQVVDAAREQPVLYLLDEILHGTNTSERRIAARTVIHHLVATDAIGMVSTHDLELIDAELAAHATTVHLVDQIVNTEHGPEMRFDYKVKPGLAPSSNALRLLELVGLGPQPRG